MRAPAGCDIGLVCGVEPIRLRKPQREVLFRASRWPKTPVAKYVYPEDAAATLAKPHEEVDSFLGDYGNKVGIRFGAKEQHPQIDQGSILVNILCVSSILPCWPS